MSDQYPPRDPNQQRPPVSPRPPAERIPGLQREATRAVAPKQEEQPRRRPARRPDPSRSPLYVPWWGFAIVILVVAGITCGLWALVFMNRGDVVVGVGPTPTPIFVVITATPTLGPAPGEASPTPDGGDVNTPSVTEFAPGAASPTPDESLPILVGSLVEVFGTEGDGVAVRQGPGLSYSFFFVGQDGDRFNVEDGPRDGDGYTWWQLTDPNDPNRAGWVVENFLRVIIQ